MNQNSLRYGESGVSYYRIERGKLKYINEKLARKITKPKPKEYIKMEQPMLPENVILLQHLKQYYQDAFANGKNFIENEAGGKLQLANIMEFIQKNSDRALTYNEIVAGAQKIEQERAQKHKYKILYQQDMDNLSDDTPDKIQALIHIYEQENNFLSKNKIASLRGLAAGNGILKQVFGGVYSL
jgi:hypothetical protein